MAAGVLRSGMMAMAVALITGCTSVSLNNTDPSSASGTPQAVLNQQIDKLLLEQRSVCMSAQYEAMRQKNPCSIADITFAQLADNSKITNTQRPQVIDAYTKMDKLYQEITALYQAFGTEQATKVVQARNWAYEQSLKNRLSLVNGQITWGQFLDQRKQINTEMMRRAR